MVSIHGRPGDRPLRGCILHTLHALRVSIHGRPGDRPLPQFRAGRRPGGDVSIHGRPGDRPLPLTDACHRAVDDVSIHGRPGDRPLLGHARRTGIFAPGFNPRPARRPAAPRWHMPHGHEGHVSIHGRPGDRPLRALGVEPRRSHGFQSTAGPETGRSATRRFRPAGPACFNPRPARRPAAPGHDRAGVQGDQGFNPRPARRPAAPVFHGARVHVIGGFNPRPARRPAAPQPPPSAGK